MNILLVAAAPIELEPILKKWELENIQQHNAVVVNSSFHILFTGMGMMNTAAHLTHYCHLFRPDIIIEAGICGAFDRNLSIGDVVHVASEAYGDFGVEDGDDFKDFFELGFITSKEDNYRYGKQYPKHSFEQFIVDRNLISVDSVTVNKVHGKEESIASIMEKYPAKIENMEGLAVFYVSHMLGIPCIAFRSVSNYVERRNKDNWDIPLAVSNLNDVILDFLKYIA
jgi:futalosine hydrolase